MQSIDLTDSDRCFCFATPTIRLLKIVSDCVAWRPRSTETQPLVNVPTLASLSRSHHHSGWVVTFAPLRTIEIQQSGVDIAARRFMRSVDASDIDILGSDVRARLWAGTDQVSDKRSKDTVGPAANVLEIDVRDVEARLSGANV